MVFTSFSFLVFFAAAMAVYFLAPQRWRWAVLLAVSLYFYLSASIRYAVFLLLSALSTYDCGRYLGSCAARQRDYLQTHRGTLSPEEKKQYRAAVGRRKRRVLALTLVLNLGILGFLKYFNFLSDNVGSLIRLFVPEFSPVRLSLALPLGISFYTFQVVGYCLDVYREVTEPQRNFLKYLLFVSFFPQTMQGPIGRYDELAPQLYQGCGFSYRRVCFGLQRMLWGFFEKLVIADRLTMLVDTVFGGWQTYGARHLVVAVVCYAIQIYADFAGYMDIALGAGQVFGIELAENFQQPYFSRGIPEFWRRWHQTLGSWFKDYLFYPVLRAGWCKTLGARLKRRWGKDAAAKATTVLALGIVWFTTGLWHGASWHYIAWGLYYGVLIILLHPVFTGIGAAVRPAGLEPGQSQRPAGADASDLCAGLRRLCAVPLRNHDPGSGDPLAHCDPGGRRRPNSVHHGPGNQRYEIGRSRHCGAAGSGHLPRQRHPAARAAGGPGAVAAVAGVSGRPVCGAGVRCIRAGL